MLRLTREGDDRRGAFALHMFFLVLTIILAVVIVLPTLTHYLDQRAEVRLTEMKMAEAQARTASLESELKQWNDPEFIRMQARSRLGYVAPGETLYVVTNPEIIVGGTSPVDRERAEYENTVASLTPWYLTLWESVEIAGKTDATTDKRPGKSDNKDDSRDTGEPQGEQDGNAEGAN